MFAIKSTILLKKEFDCEPIHDKYFLKIKVKSYIDESIYYHDREMPKVDSSYICLAVILISFVLKKHENYCLQVFVKECKNIEKEKKVIRYITDDLEIFLMILLENRLKLNNLSDLF